MTSESFARRAAWRRAWWSAALGAISLGSLVHLLADASLQHSLASALVHSAAVIGFLSVSVRSAMRALDESFEAPAHIQRAHRWEAFEPLATDRPASRAA